MANNDRIIVIHSFNSPIEASIVKTKLDAYGIPCFLSEENLTHLTTPLLSGGVRLHIFERDIESVKSLMLEECLQKVEEDDLLRCPVCHSKRILSGSEKRFDPSSIAIFLLQVTKKHYCLDCETEFDH
jgi:hypothetical protein